jgi:alkylation response protein AidB-like acyl-CoA dehydrogenase
MVDLNPQQQALQARARELARQAIAPRAAEIDRTEQYPWENVRLLKEAGFMGMTIPKAYGGQGLGFFDAVLAIEQMAQVCGVTGRIVVEANMGAISAIMRYGSEAQKRLAAGLVLEGDKPAICITEPEAGSAASEMTTRADKRGDVYVLNGRKHWITGGGVSRLHLIFARVFDAAGEEQGIAGFVAVRGEARGLEIGRRSHAMGLRGIPETEILFRDLEIPASMALIPPEGMKRGFAGLMNAYNSQRVGAATVALGLAEGAYELALERAKTREQFGRPIAEFQGLQWMLADMSIGIAAAQALVYKAAASNPAGFPDPTQAAQAKVLASETAIEVTNDALQIFGAEGYGRDLPLERMVRDARMFTIGGGTAQILRTVIASRILDRKLPQTRDGYMDLERGRNEK